MKKLLSVLLSLAFVLSVVPLQISKALDNTEGYYTYTLSGIAPNIVASITAYSGLDAVVTVPDTLGGYPVTTIKYQTVSSVIKGAFEGHEEITSITLPAALASISTDAFRACTGITEITLPDTLTSIGTTSFYGCTGLLKIKTGAAATLASIGQEAFRNCTHITEIAVPDSVKTLGISVFNGCTGIVNASIGSGITAVPANAFAGCTGLTKVIIGKSVSSIDLSAFKTCTGLKEIVVDAENINFSTIYDDTTHTYGCVLFNKEQTKLIQYLVNETAGYTVPNGVTEIGTKAFENWTRLTAISMPDTVEVIGTSAFSGCTGLQNVVIPGGDYIDNAVRYYYGVADITEKSFYGCTGLKTVTFPSSVESIGTSAFSGCTALESVVIGSRVEEIGTSAFSGCVGMLSLTLNGSLVTIGNSSFLNCTGLVEVTIPNSVTAIGASSFSGCEKITVLNIGSSVETIGASAFANCKALLSVTVPDSVITIGTSVFSGCTALTEATVGDGVAIIPEKLFNGCSSLTVATLGSGVSFIYLNSFNYTALVEFYIDDNNPYFSSQDCIIFNKDKTVLYHYLYSRERSYTIPGSVMTIHEQAFYTCPQLTGITIPSSVTVIEKEAFYGCTGLGEVSLPNGVTVINDSLFYGCTGLTSVTFPNALVSVGVSAFSGCSKLTGIIFPETLSVINAKSFLNCTALTSLVIPNNVTSIGSEAFSGCKLLAGVVLSNILTNIADKTFYKCTALATIAIPDSVTNIGASAFYGCTGLSALNISKGATNIGASAFYGCTKLTSLRIPNKVTIIGDNAFYGCTGLTRLVLGSVVSDIGVSAFKGCTALTAVAVPNNVSSLGDTAFQSCTKLKSVYFYGSAPLMGTTVFGSCASGFTVYYLSSAAGFSNPWNGYPAAVFTPSSEIVITPSTSAPTNKDITVSIDYLLDADLREFKIDNGIWSDYLSPLTVSANCTVWARCTDLFGNITSTVHLDITNVDQIAPEAPVLQASPLTPTGGNVTVSITFSADAAVKEYKIGTGNWTSYTVPVNVSDNTVVYARCADAAGNVSSISSVTISNIDKTVPSTPVLSAAPLTPTNGNVNVTVVYPVDATVKQYKIGSGDWTDYTGIIVLTSNNTVYARCQNALGNTSASGSLVVANIDKTAPSVPGLSAAPQVPTNGNVAVTITYPSDAAVKQYKIGNGIWTAYTAAVVLSANNTVYARCADAVGNFSSEGSVVVANIDKTPPDMPAISADPSTVTNGNVAITITYPADAVTKQYKIGTGGAWTIYTTALNLSANNTVYARCTDAAGNSSSESSIIVSNIDKTAPGLPAFVSAPAVPTNGNVTVTITYPDDAVVKEYKIGGDVWSAYTEPVILSVNGTVYARCADAAGNVSAVGSTVVNYIDRTSPDIPVISASPTEPTNGSVTVTITYPADAAVKEYKIGEGEWIAYNSPLDLTANGTVYAQCKDAAGNLSGTASAAVNNIAAFVRITDSNGVPTDDVLSVKVAWYKLYKKITLQLGFITNDSKYKKVEWISDNSKVIVDQNGFISNIKTGARAAVITVKLTDSNGITVTDTVKVIFYKFKYQLKNLQSQSIDEGDNLSADAYMQDQTNQDVAALTDTAGTRNAGSGSNLNILIKFMEDIYSLISEAFF